MQLSAGSHSVLVNNAPKLAPHGDPEEEILKHNQELGAFFMGTKGTVTLPALKAIAIFSASNCPLLCLSSFCVAHAVLMQLLKLDTALCGVLSMAAPLSELLFKKPRGHVLVCNASVPSRPCFELHSAQRRIETHLKPNHTCCPCSLP